MDFTTAVSQVMQLAQSKPESLQEIAQNQDLIKAGVEILKQSEPQVLEMISKPGGMRKILSQLKNQTKMAKQGTKLEYIQRLKGICPEGYETTYMKAGGKVCPVCKKKKAAEKRALHKEIPADRQGGIIGGVSEAMNLIKAQMFQQGGTFEDDDDKKVKQLQAQRDALLKQAQAERDLKKKEAIMKKVRDLNAQIGRLGVEE